MYTLFRSLRVIHLILTFGAFSVYVVLFTIIGVDINVFSTFNKDLLLLAIPACILVASAFVHHQFMRHINQSKYMDENMLLFQTASIIRWTLTVSAAVIISIITPAFLVLGWAVLIYLLFQHPTKQQYLKMKEKALTY